MSQNTAPVTHRETVREYLTVRQVQERQDLERVHPVGEIDLYTAPALRDALADTDRREVPNVMVDLSQVHFLALIGIQVLQAAGERKAEANRRLVVVASTPNVQRVLSLTDVAADLEIYTSTSGARSALAR
ncbi:STAS domain-containing protein [Actinophytocola sp.]|uniref:STAS domain-containing protein n=1 Tax=Actinophytocola sp. TaxID=1872138 RepID=UPI002ED5BEF1